MLRARVFSQGPKLFLVSIMLSGKTVSYESRWFLTCCLLTMLKQPSSIMLVFRFSDFLSYPKPRFIIHQCEEIFHIILDLDVKLIGSPCVAYIWSYLVNVPARAFIC